MKGYKTPSDLTDREVLDMLAEIFGVTTSVYRDSDRGEEV